MADITTTGSSGYGIGEIDTAAVLVNGVSPRRAQHVNGPASAAVQIETVLGSALTLKGTQTNLASRLAVALSATGLFALTNGPSYITDRGFTAASPSALQIMNHTPIGVVQAFAGSSAPANWLLCDGSAVSRSTYAKLFAIVATTYGVGDGSTTFNVPDLRGRTVVMVDGSAARITAASTNGANADTLGGVGGAETHTLVISEMPAHTHVPRRNTLTSSGNNTIANANLNATPTSLDLATTSTGGDGAHSNTQPWLALNYIIFVGV